MISEHQSVGRAQTPDQFDHPSVGVRLAVMREVTGDGDKFGIWMANVHIVNHGTEHLTELAHYLTDVGHSPGEINFMHYLTNIEK